MKIIRKMRIVLIIIVGMILLLGGGYIYNNCKQERETESEEKRKIEYIKCLKKLGVYSEDGSNLGIDNVLFQAKEVNGMYVREGHLQVWLRTLYLIKDVDLTIDDIYSLYEQENQEIQKKFDLLMEYFYDGASEYVGDYIKEINNAYNAYLEMNGEKYNAKESNQLTIEDCISLEGWILENPDSGKYPSLLKWYELREEQ
ncbi:hypothetical protein [Roseburia sp. 499]|uniref:hypothetical protein n=1 Tax=Roseburia sp. 499 TaxID=1261634 RepID=UPI00095118F7|nr:hypothetical protein [Roseburia sp. 499]WVK68493.1 hypothetical protein BIV20_08820 [Roseburia sp. 499]